MKITDTTGRAMLVDLVYKDPKMGWLQAPEFCLKGRGTRFLQVPLGEYAIRICSTTGADVIVHENGERLIATSVPARTQFITNDSSGQPLTFRAPGDTVRAIAAPDVALNADNSAELEGEGTKVSEAPAADVLMVPAPAAPAGHGLVYVIVRFAKENSPYGEPPQEEFEIAFQMHEVADFENKLAENAHLLVEAPPLPNPRDPMSREPLNLKHDTNSHVHCAFCDHSH